MSTADFYRCTQILNKILDNFLSSWTAFIRVHLRLSVVSNLKIKISESPFIKSSRPLRLCGEAFYNARKAWANDPGDGWQPDYNPK
jgi:hypothetical protein